MKRTWNFAIAVTLTVGLCGCGSDEDEGISKTSSTADKSSTAEKEGKPTPQAQPPLTPVVMRNRLKELGVAFFNSHDSNRHFPSAGAFLDADNKPLLSWRVNLLPHLENRAIYGKFNFSEPWDSEHNKKLLEEMPQFFTSPGVTEPGMTSLVVLTGPTTPFHGKYEPYLPPAKDEFGNAKIYRKGPKIRDFTDGTGSTILAIFAPPEKAVPWTKPADLVFDPEKPLESIGQIPESGLMVLFANGSVGTLPKTISADLLRNLVEHQDGNPVDLSEL